MDRDPMRASDEDRRQVVEQLRAAVREGRISPGECEDRVREAHAAMTYAALGRLLADLPATRPVVPALADPRDRYWPSGAWPWLARIWRTWAKATALLTVMWLIPAPFRGELANYWPVWVVGPWGLLLVIRTLRGLAAGEPRRLAVRQEYRRRRREYKAACRAHQARAIAFGELPARPTREQRRQFLAEAESRSEIPPRPTPPGDS